MSGDDDAVQGFMVSLTEMYSRSAILIACCGPIPSMEDATCECDQRRATELQGWVVQLQSGMHHHPAHRRFRVYSRLPTLIVLLLRDPSCCT
jgi:hypothetical protein